MMYATLDEAWSRKPRVKRLTHQKMVSRQHVVLKDPALISHFAGIENPDEYVIGLIKLGMEHEKEVNQEKVPVEPVVAKAVKRNDKEDLVFLLYFLVLLVLLY